MFMYNNTWYDVGRKLILVTSFKNAVVIEMLWLCDQSFHWYM